MITAFEMMAWVFAHAYAGGIASRLRLFLERLYS
jgi:hypothetical protein